MKFLRKTTDN